MISLGIPIQLRPITSGQSTVHLSAESAESVESALVELDRLHVGIKDRICDDKGKVRRFINIFVNEEDIRFLDNEKTQLKDGDEVVLLAAVAGG